MLERGNGAGLALEPRAPLRIRRHVGRQHFDRDRPIEPRVAGLVDFAHPARAEQREDLVRAEAHAGGQSQVGRILARTGSRTSISPDQSRQVQLTRAAETEEPNGRLNTRA